MQEGQPDRLTEMLNRAGEGDRSTLARLLPMVHAELRALAGACFRSQRGNHTLQPTALIHEAYLKLSDEIDTEWKDRKHFFAVAAKVMREVLADYARGHLAQKRGGDWRRVTFDPAVSPLPVGSLDLIELDEALTKLSSLNERHSAVAELRFLGGLNVEDVAEVLGVSRRTVELDWRTARAWLRRELSGSRP